MKHNNRDFLLVITNNLLFIALFLIIEHRVINQATLGYKSLIPLMIMIPTLVFSTIMFLLKAEKSSITENIAINNNISQSFLNINRRYIFLTLISPLYTIATYLLYTYSYTFKFVTIGKLLLILIIYFTVSNLILYISFIYKYQSIKSQM